jgi:putative oxidoreductase
MTTLHRYHDKLNAFLSGPVATGVALLSCRFALAGVFWRAGRTKVTDGSLLTISDTTRFLFEHEYSRVPLPPEIAVHLATYAEHLFPLLLLLGLATRLSAAALLLMTLVIQVFVYPEAWWAVHSLWAALALVLVAGGGGVFSVDRLLHRAKKTRTASAVTRPLAPATSHGPTQRA